MYLAAVILLLLVLPLLSAAFEAILFAVPDPALLLGKWFTFWGAGVRLFMAGLSQIFRPQFTAQDILGIKGGNADVLVREVGFGNLALGTLGILSLVFPDWLIPAAVAGALFYGLAGAGHVARKEKTAKEWIALVSDLFTFLVLAAFIASRLAVLGA